MTFPLHALTVAAKDLRVEVRGRHALGVMLPFACTQLIAFGLSFGPDRSLVAQTAPALFWLAVFVASVLTFRGAYEAEGEDGALDGLLLAPVDKGAVFIGKAGAVIAQLLALEMAIVDLTGALFGVGTAGDLPRLFVTLMLGTVGLASVGSLFGVLTEAARAREAVFPLLVLPVTTPVLIASIDRAGVG